jgi:hypothetical protein
MKTNQTITALASIYLACAVSALAQQNTDELKQRVLTHAQSLSENDYAFTRTVRTEQTSKGKTEKKVVVEKFDPTKSGSARWTLVSVNAAAPSADDLKNYAKEISKRRVVPGYHRVAGYFGSPATTSTEGGKTVFRFPTLPKGAVSVLETDVSQNTTAEATVTEASGVPYVEQVRFTVKPMRIKLVIKLDRFETTARYRIGPAGKPVLMDSTSEMMGSGMGQEGIIRTTATYSDHRAVR